MSKRHGLVPFYEWPGIQEVFEEFPQWMGHTSEVTVSEDDSHIYVEAALPGIHPEEVEITFDRGTLLIRGEKKEGSEDKKRKFYRRASRSFSYQVNVPGDLDESVEPEATFEHGVVKICFAKQKKVMPKKIAIKS